MSYLPPNPTNYEGNATSVVNRALSIDHLQQILKKTHSPSELKQLYFNSLCSESTWCEKQDSGLADSMKPSFVYSSELEVFRLTYIHLLKMSCSICRDSNNSVELGKSETSYNEMFLNIIFISKNFENLMYFSYTFKCLP